MISLERVSPEGRVVLREAVQAAAAKGESLPAEEVACIVALHTETERDYQRHLRREAEESRRRFRIVHDNAVLGPDGRVVPGVHTKPYKNPLRAKRPTKREKQARARERIQSAAAQTHATHA